MREDSDLAILREMANLAREYFDERNRPAVSWDGMPSVQEQKYRRERIVDLIDRLSSAPSRGSESNEQVDVGLNGEEREWVEGVRAEFAGYPGVVRRLLAIIDRLGDSGEVSAVALNGDLKPCPFCGWQVTAADVDDENEYTAFTPYYRVVCQECGGMCEGHEDYGAAVMNWNRRR